MKREMDKKIKLVKVEGEISYCLCGRLLNKKWNKSWDGKRKFCNSKCEKSYKGA